MTTEPWRPSQQHATVPGLTTAQVKDRVARGLTNRTTRAVSRPLSAILSGNLFTLFNGILAGAVVLLLVVGQERDAILVGALIVFSVLVGIAQEVRAKHRLDQIALLARPRVRVIRDGREQTIPPEQVVLDDAFVLAPGEQAVADGILVRADALEMDESLLTGEAEPVAKRPGDRILSGSFCVAGTGIVVVTAVGSASYVQTLTAVARQYRNIRTPLQRFIDRVLRVLLVIILGLSIAQLAVFLTAGTPLVEAARATAVIATLVPQGLLVMSTVAYSVGALRVARYGGLVQQLNAVESLSHVDVLCMDKTGTITEHRIVLREIIPLGDRPTPVEDLVGTFAASAPALNTTLRAIAARLPRPPRPVKEAVPFRADRKWSGLTFAEPAPGATYVLGAPEVMLPAAIDGNHAATIVDQHVAAGQRVLIFAGTHAPASLRAPDGTPCLPPALRALAVVVLEEAIRADAPATLRAFAEQGVTLKIISGDHPKTVLALARRAGLPAMTATSGAELADLPRAAFATTVERMAVFGRITPQQKQAIIRALQANGHYVAMVGDGANDVLALKEAQLGIAMQSGSPAARAVADMVLLGDTFAALPATLAEGRRIVNSMVLLVRLFLIRDVATIELIMATQLLGMPFPLLPPHVTIVAFLTVGLPALFLVGWASPMPPGRNPAQSLVRVVLTLGTISALAMVATDVLMTIGFRATPEQARTAVTTVAVLSGLATLICLVQRSISGARSSARRWIGLLVGGLIVVYAGLLALPTTRRTFELTTLTAIEWAIMLAIVGICFGGLAATGFCRRRRYSEHGP